MISVHGFSKAYDQTVAVRELSFAIAPGQIMGIVGPNGAGKTTTLRALAGIVPPSGGQLRVAGFDVERDALEVKQRLAYIPDDPQLFYDLTVEQHLAFIASVYQVSDAAAKVQHLLDAFQIAEKRHTPAGDLSRGMRQKLAISCAYLHDPQAILFDEPLTGLDPQGIRTLKQSILDRAQAGAAIMVSSHLLAMVEDICTHVMILDRGQERFCGDLSQLRQAFSAAPENVTLEAIFFEATGASALARSVCESTIESTTESTTESVPEMTVESMPASTVSGTRSG